MYSVNLMCSASPDRDIAWHNLKNLFDAQFAGEFHASSDGMWGTLKYAYPGFLDDELPMILWNMFESSAVCNGGPFRVVLCPNGSGCTIFEWNPEGEKLLFNKPELTLWKDPIDEKRKCIFKPTEKKK